MMRAPTWLWSCFLLLLVAAPAAAETRRLAVVVANNVGGAMRPPLRFAESDAVKMSETLVELGGVARADLLLLTGRSLADVRAGLAATSERVKRLRGGPTHVMLVFYFSGHSDGEALELGGARLGFDELRRWLASTGADVRLVIVDSCRSGALLAEKGGAPAQAFQIHLTDELASTGEALLTSSAADEVALESREIRGSFFTHHLVSGLRGAADSSGDGLVTLAEAYQYTFARTVSATAATLPGPQHPGYDYKLVGQGDLVLATLSHPTATLVMPGGVDRAVVVAQQRDQVVAELPAGAPRRLALPAGDYTVHAWRSGLHLSGHAAVHGGETRTVALAELRPAPAGPLLAAKGDDPTWIGGRPRSWPALFVGAGAQGAVAVPAYGSLRLGLRWLGPSGPALNLQVSTGGRPGLVETAALMFVGYRLGIERGRLGGFLGLEAGGGLVSQNVLAGTGAGTALRTAALGGAVWPGISVRLSERLVLTLEGEVPLLWARKEGKNALLVLPAGWLGLQVRL